MGDLEEVLGPAFRSAQLQPLCPLGEGINGQKISLFLLLSVHLLFNKNKINIKRNTTQYGVSWVFQR